MECQEICQTILSTETREQGEMFATNETENSLDNIARKSRCLLYEQLAYDYIDFWMKDPFFTFSPEQEAMIHIRRIGILLLYFNRIIIQYNNVLNHPSSPRENMMLFLLQARDFRYMMEKGLVLFVGKGGVRYNDISSFHNNYIDEFGSPNKNPIFHDTLKAGFTVSRSIQTHPDHEFFKNIKKKMENHLRKTSSEYIFLERYIGDSANNVDNDIRYPPLYRALPSLEVTSAEFYTLNKILHTASLDAVTKQQPNIYVFNDFSFGPIGDLRMLGMDNENPVLAFLYNPDVFLSILSLLVSSHSFDRLLRLPIAEFITFATVDHKRFSDSYHRLIFVLDGICSDELVIRSAQTSPSSLLDLTKRHFEDLLDRRSKGVEIKGVFDFITGLINVLLGAHGIPSLAGALLAPFRNTTHARLNLLFRRLHEPALVEFVRRINPIP
jgi:hypothetical protein